MTSTTLNKQYRMQIELPGYRGLCNLTTEENPAGQTGLANSLFKNLDTTLFFEQNNSGTETIIHAGSPDGPIIGWIREEHVPRSFSYRFLAENRKQHNQQVAA